MPAPPVHVVIPPERSALTPVPTIETGPPDLSCPENRHVLEHWLGLRGGEAVPERTRFNPMQLPRILPRIIMLEPQGPESALIRTFGSELARRLGMDLTGIDLVSVYEGPRRRDVLELLHAVREERAIAVAYSEWTTPSGFRFVTENLWLPFAGGGGEVTRIMGALHEPDAPPEDMESLGGSVAASQSTTERRYYRP